LPDILIASTSAEGHLEALLSVAQGLVERSDRVTVLAAATRAAAIRAVGARPCALHAKADAEWTRVYRPMCAPADARARPRMDIILRHLYIAPIPHQTAQLAELFAQNSFDAVIADSTFFGILPFLVGERSARPPVLLYSTTPLTMSSRDTAPFYRGQAPPSNVIDRWRNRAWNALQPMALRQPQRSLNAVLNRMNSRPLPVPLLDAGRLADRVIVPTVAAFEYPRSDLAANVRFVGAVEPVATYGLGPPGRWWRLESSRPVVHVSQGAADSDFGRLLRPTIHALRDEDVFVVATTGDADPNRIVPSAPANTLVARRIPHEVLLPKVDVMVSNGGYHAVLQALSHGVPVVVAADTDDRPEVAARVAWSGAGINLGTGTPTARAVRCAVRAILGDGRYTASAKRLARSLAERDGVAEIAEQVDEVIWESACVRR
jgi:MGT family glycosyltransferase